MPIEVELPDGSIAEFPDGTPQEKMQQALSRHVQTSLDTSGAGRFASSTRGATIPQANPVMDVAKSAGVGLARGAIGIPGLPGTVEQLGRAGINAVGSMMGRSAPVVSPETVLPTGEDLQRRVEGVTGKFYQPQTTAGEYARTLGEFAPGALFPGGVAQRVFGNVVGPAVASETAGQAMKGTSLEPVARVAGALAGGHLANIPARTYTPVPTSPQRQAAVQTLRNEGVTSLTAGEVTGAKPLRYLESHASDIPMSGGRAHTLNAESAEQFTRAALRRAGIQADRADAQTLNAAFARIGADFDRLAQASRARFGASDVGAIRQSVADYQALTPPSAQVPIVSRLMQDVENATTGVAPMTGQQYARYRSMIEGLARGTQDPGVARTLRDITQTLDRAVERGLPPNMQGQWRQARNEYRNMLVLEKAATSAGAAAAEGIITPAALMRANKAIQGTRGAARGRGDFADLANAGRVVMDQLPNSGTPARMAAASFGQAVGAGGGALAGGPIGAFMGAAAAPVGQAMLARGFMSRPMQNFLGANARMAPYEIDGRLGGLVALPSAVAQSGNPLEVTVYPPGDPRNR